MSSGNEIKETGTFPFPRILEFLRRVHPFDALTHEELISLAPQMEIAYYMRGEMIIRQGERPPAHLYLIYLGSVRITISDDLGQKTLVDLRAEGDIFGASSILQGKQALFDVTAEEDVIAFLLPAEVFRQLIGYQPAFKRYFSFPLARSFRVMGQVADPQLRHEAEVLDPSVLLVEKRVADLMSTDLVTCGPTTSVRAAAKLMSQSRVGSILIMRGDSVPLGILTDRDLRVKVLAEGLGLDTPVTEVMSRPVLTVDSQAYVFDALVEMSRHGVRHIAATEGERLVGMISEHDLQTHAGNSPLRLIGEIERARSIDELVSLRPKVDRVLEMFLRRGSSIQRMVDLGTELNDRVTLRMLGIGERDMEKQGFGRVPVPYSWMAMGSEGRREQSILTDQDNALVFANVPEEDHQKVRDWFLLFSKGVVESLVRYGIPHCPSDFMASNPEWCQCEKEWEKKFFEWMEEPAPKVVRTFSVFADFRAIFAETDFLITLREKLNEAVIANRIFLRFLAGNGLYDRPPLGFFRQFVVEKSGEHRKKLNLKKRGLIPIVSAVRVLALDAGVKETNTLQRLREIDKVGAMDHELLSDLSEVYSFITFLRVRHHFRARAGGEKADNFINPSDLNTLERKMLKESFALISAFQKQMTSRYLTEFLVRP